MKFRTKRWRGMWYAWEDEKRIKVLVQKPEEKRPLVALRVGC
jgi:hypothetical protein